MLHLDPEDWLYATWRPREIRIRPDPPPFTVESGLKRLERFTKKAKYHRPWIEARMATAMIPEEARFWLGAMLAIAGQERAHYWMTQLPESKDLLIQALRTDLNRTPPIAEVIERINVAGAVWVDLSAAVLLPLSILYTWDEVLEFLAKVTWRPQGRHLVWNYDHVFRRRSLCDCGKRFARILTPRAKATSAKPSRRCWACTGRCWLTFRSAALC